ncbi:acyl-CoA dehydrogenase family protein [Nocardioides sp.]|uniref:acyl-CoA dehydrogenase family protein n=1 Tax=Nocardioides sp. TaxID=35761 RepID=UPI0039E45E10
MTDLLYSDVEESLRASLASALARVLPDPGATAALYDDPDSDVSAVWTMLADQLGLAALLVPERHGGAGASPREAAVVLEELGKTVAPAPFLTSAVIATTALSAVGDAPRLERLAAGQATAALVVPWSARAGQWTATAEGEDVQPVAGAIEADILVVPVTDAEGLALRIYQAGEATVAPLTSLDMTRPLASVAVSGPGTVVARDDQARQAVDSALLAGQSLLASEQYGLARQCLQLTVEYATTRIQFARPIGSFQAIKHRLADLYLQVIQAGAVARYAADTVARADEDAPVASALAQAYCSDVAVKAAEEALQLHGGIGMTWEHPLHLYLKRAKADQLALGTASRHREDLAELVGLVA